jgi:hypothetical protein
MGDDSLNLVLKIYGRVDEARPEKSLRLTLVRGELLKLPDSARSLAVLSGAAWISHEGRDLVLRAGEGLSFERGSGPPALLSALGEEALFIRLS